MMRKGFILNAIAALLSVITAEAESVQTDRYTAVSDSTSSATLTVRGSLTSSSDTTVVWLLTDEGSLMRVAATDTLNAGQFAFSLNVPCEVRKYSLTTPDKHVKVDFYAAGGMEVSVRGRADCLATWKVTSPAPEQRLENALREAAESYEIQRETVLTDYYRLGDKLKNGENIDREQMKMLKAQLDTLQAQTFSCEMGVLEQWPINEQWLKKLSSIAAYCEILPTLMDRPRAINLYNRLSDEQKASDLGQRMLWALYPENKVKEGMKSPDGNFISPDGKQHKLAEFRGKYVLVDFWFNGCMPCRLSIPELGEVSNQYKGRLEVVSLSLDAMKIWAEATDEHPITWNNWNDKKGRNGLYAKFPIQGVPFYVLLSPDGTVIAMQAGYAKGEIKKLLKKHLGD